MATFAHCAYCFESLSASLESRQPQSLSKTEALWDKYNSAFETDEDSRTDSEEASIAQDEDGDVEMDDGSTESGPPRPAAISRLLAPSPASASSTPSTRSTASSRAEASSESSKNSSRTSIFSFGKRPNKRTNIFRSNPSSGSHPLFVTWNTISRSGNKSLRGCIGTFEAQDLDQGLANYALTSAFEDARFLPITLRELPSLECGITLLTNFEPVSDPMSWELGKHGLRISFVYHGRRYGATYLPDVAREQGWTKEETMVSLMRKAGWTGRKDEWRKVEDLQVIRYQGKKEQLGYREWRDWRDWVDEQGFGPTPLN